MTKHINKHNDQYMASCPAGLEELLLNEIKSFKLKVISQIKGNIHFEGFPEEAIKFLINTRIASRVFKKMFSFEIKNEEDLYRRALDIKWKSVFNLEQTFKIKAQQLVSPNGEKWSQFKSPIFLSQRLKDAIADRFTKDLQKRPDVDKFGADVSFLMQLQPHDNPYSKKEDVAIYIDMAGNPLSNRGYRVARFPAPLRENLAAALVQLIELKKDEMFIDPMCGSGTIAIEACMYKLGLPSSYLKIIDMIEHEERPWDFLDHNYYTKNKYITKNTTDYIQSEYESIKKKLKSDVIIKASDKDKFAIKAAEENIQHANLTKQIILEQANALDINGAGADSGVVLLNPPYGERIGEIKQLEKTYYEFGENLKNNFKGYRAGIFTGNMPLIKKISLRTSKKIPLYNGDIESRLAVYELF